jgi:flagellar biosynthesis protein FlhA
VEALGVPAEELSEAADPVIGEPGCWAPLAHAGRLAKAGFPLWQDPLAFMVRQLEALLHNHLSRFLGVQETAALLESWSQEASGAALVRAAIPDAATRLRFGWLLQALLDEKAPITDWRAILQSVAATGLPDRDVSAPLQAVRLALREQLPGNRPGAIHLPLPPLVESSLESWIWRENGVSFLALPPEETQEALAALRELLAPHEDSRNLALIVSSGELRLPLRRLIALEFPQVAVLSRDEVMAQTPEEVEDA